MDMTQSKYPYHYLWYTLPSYCDDWHFLNNIKRLAISGKGDIICIDIEKKRERGKTLSTGVCVCGGASVSPSWMCSSVSSGFLRLSCTRFERTGMNEPLDQLRGQVQDIYYKKDFVKHA